jgi:hypothetical protein
MDAQERLLGRTPECRGRMDAQERQNLAFESAKIG